MEQKFKITVTGNQSYQFYETEQQKMTDKNGNSNARVYEELYNAKKQLEKYRQKDAEKNKKILDLTQQLSRSKLWPKISLEYPIGLFVCIFYTKIFAFFTPTFLQFFH